MGDKLWCGQAQNGINLDFDLKFDLEGLDRSLHKTIGTLTKLLCIFGSNLLILAWTGPELIPEGQNWPRVIKSQYLRMYSKYFPSLKTKTVGSLVIFISWKDNLTWSQSWISIYKSYKLLQIDMFWSKINSKYLMEICDSLATRGAVCCNAHKILISIWPQQFPTWIGKHLSTFIGLHFSISYNSSICLSTIKDPKELASLPCQCHGY